MLPDPQHLPPPSGRCPTITNLDLVSKTHPSPSNQGYTEGEYTSSWAHMEHERDIKGLSEIPHWPQGNFVDLAGELHLTVYGRTWWSHLWKKKRAESLNCSFQSRKEYGSPSSSNPCPLPLALMPQSPLQHPLAVFSQPLPTHLQPQGAHCYQRRKSLNPLLYHLCLPPHCCAVKAQIPSQVNGMNPGEWSLPQSENMEVWRARILCQAPKNPRDPA